MDQRVLEPQQAGLQRGLAKSLQLEDGSLLAHCQRLYTLEMHRLKMRHQNGADGSLVTASRAVLIDNILQIIWEAVQRDLQPDPSKHKVRVPPASLIAMGEYGSFEIGPFSPVELLLLGKPSSKEIAESRLQGVLDTIQRIGFEMQTSILGMRECLQRTQTDLPLCLSLLSARRISGDEGTFQDFNGRFLSGLFRNRLAYIYELTKLLEQFHQLHGASVYLLESNIEFGAGGLWDYRALLSSIKLLTGSQNPKKILAEGVITPLDWKHTLAARQHLLRVRNQLHFLNQRRQDVLTGPLSASVAGNFGYRDTRRLKGTEIFLRDTLRHRKRIHMTLVRFMDQEKANISEDLEGSNLRDLGLSSGSAVLQGEPTPELWMKIFQFSQTQPLLLTDSLKTTIRSNVGKWGIHSFCTASMHDRFRSILRNKGKVGTTLRTMRDLGFLGKYLPEFATLDCLPQLDLASSYTVDELILRAIDVLDEVANSTNPILQDYHRVLEQITDPSLVYLALLLHGSVKQSTQSPTAKRDRLVGRVLQRLNFGSESREDVLLLVREHFLLAQVSQRRDLDDPLIVQEVSATVETADNLNMLLLLTYAILQSMGEPVWSERKNFLLWSLYFKVYDRLRFGDEISEPEHARVAEIQQKALEYLGPEFEAGTVLEHFMFLPEKYVLYTPLSQILSHVRLCERLGDRPVVTEWVPHSHAGYTELMLSTPDVPGRFAQIAGCLAVNEISILSAQLDTRDDGIVIDTFQLSDSEGKAIMDSESWGRIDRLLNDVISGEVALDSLLTPRFRSRAGRQASSSTTPRVRIDNDISSQSTVIEVQTEDRLGLGYLIAKTLAELGLNIVSAKLATERKYVFDVFYVQTREGGKITANFQMIEVLERLRSQLTSA